MHSRSRTHTFLQVELHFVHLPGETVDMNPTNLYKVTMQCTVNIVPTNCIQFRDDDDESLHIYKPQYI